MDKRYYTLPPRPRHRWWHKGLRAAAGSMLGFPYWLLARGAGGPGLDVHRDSVKIALDLLRRGGAGMPAANTFFLAAWPLDSTRYIELPFALDALAGRQIARYLDVSSPRLMPTLLLQQHPEAHGILINPNKVDLGETQMLIRGVGLAPRVELHECLIADVPAAPGSIDAITSMSVVEHIPEDQAAIRQMWALLRPGGVLVLSMPCAAQGWEHFVNVNHYGVLDTDREGFTFLQRVYDPAAFQARIFSITGPPRRTVVYGERTPGFLQENLRQKWTNLSYPFWREPYMMAREFQPFPAIEALPGEGVIAMEFVKA